MRYSRERKQQTRRRIIESAYRLFTVKGFDGTSIEAIMRECNLTRGGFYAHFTSKSRLYREAIKLAAARDRSAQAHTENALIETMFEEYLSAELTRDGNQNRWAFFATDVANRNPEVRNAYAAAFKSMSDKIVGRMAGRFGCSEDAVLAIAAMMIGTAAVTQTIDDAALKAKLVAACKQIATALIENKNALTPIRFFWEKEAFDYR